MLKIGMAQINETVGAFESNADKIISYIKKNVTSYDLMIFPELSLFGFPPNDLLERPNIIEAQNLQLLKIEKSIPEGAKIALGVIRKKINQKLMYNSIVILSKDSPRMYFDKTLLPSYDVFDETRFFTQGDIANNIFRFKGANILFTICEDMWAWDTQESKTRYLKNPLKDIEPNRVDLVINMSGSPYAYQKTDLRIKYAKKVVNYFNAPMVYVNKVGGQDELIFDGHSFALNPSLESDSCSAMQMPGFKEDLSFVAFENNKLIVADKSKPDSISKNKSSCSGSSFSSETKSSESIETIKKALILGLKDYVNKNGFSKVHLGVSGGIDSALVFQLAVEAFGADNVTAFSMPGPFSSPDSFKFAEKHAKTVGAIFKTIDINESYNTVIASFQKGLEQDLEFGLVNENMQARLRGLFLMAFANKEKSLLVATSNKSELAVGYSTLYGDMCGALMPIGDLLKNQVYELASSFNKHKEIIPKEIINRAPSAELRPNQKDSDSLPDYDDLDNAVKNLIEQKQAAKTELDKWLIKKTYFSEFKRWQSPPILRVSYHAFGRGRRMPITQSYKEWE